MQLWGRFLLCKKRFCLQCCFSHWGDAECSSNRPGSGLASPQGSCCRGRLQRTSPTTHFLCHFAPTWRLSPWLALGTFASFHEHVPYFPQHLCANRASTGKRDTHRPGMLQGLLKVMQSVSGGAQPEGAFVVAVFCFVFNSQPSVPSAKPQPFLVPCTMPWRQHRSSGCF